jgi:hydrogenase/urease accessory protein HupE
MTRRARGALAAALALALAGPAHAHGDASLGDFYEGLFQPFFHPEFALAAIALALWSTQQASRTALSLCAGFAASLAAGAGLGALGCHAPVSAWAPRTAALAIGAAVALRAPLPNPAVAGGVGVVVGIAQGNAATAAELAQIAKPMLWSVGLALGAVLLGAYANAVTQRFPAFWMQVGVRVAGSWITAIALLAGVMALLGA